MHDNTTRQLSTEDQVAAARQTVQDRLHAVLDAEQALREAYDHLAHLEAAQQ